MEGIRVVSLFDGMSCLQLALKKQEVKVAEYFASEVDKHAIKVTQHNFPNTQQIGDVRNVDATKLGFIDLIGGGSPCQSFSFAGKRKGMSTKDEIEILTLEHYLELKSQNFEFEGQSYLFWEYMRILNELRVINPNIKFLLENVIMGEKWQKVLTRAIGINPIQINSAKLSAQNRNRLYWTNIGAEKVGLFGDLECTIPQPKDKGILLKNILEKNVDKKYFLSEKMLKYFSERAANFNQGKVNIREEEGKVSCLTSSMASCDISDNFIQQIAVDCNGNNNLDKAGTLLARYSKGPTSYGSDTFICDKNIYSIDIDKLMQLNQKTVEIRCVAMRGRESVLLKKNIQQLEPRTDGKTNTLTSVQKDNLVMQIQTDEDVISGTLRTHKDGNGFRSVKSGKGATIPARAREDGSGQNVVSIKGNIRRLTPIECERLQTVPDGHTSVISDTQRYRVLGNGWTIDVIAYILSYY